MGKSEDKSSSSLLDWRAWQYHCETDSFVTQHMAPYAEDTMLICGPAAKRVVHCVLAGEPL